MEQLFPDSETFQKKRPSQLTENQLKEMFLELAQEIYENKWSGNYVEEIAQDLEDAYPFDDNGYELAKELEGSTMIATYDIDADFVAWLDSIWNAPRKIINQNVMLWVKAHNITLDLPVGTKLMCKIHKRGHYKEKEIFYVTGLKPETANYLIHKDPLYKGGTYCTKEDLEQNFDVIEKPEDEKPKV
jgi:hypothetical protein